MKLNSVFSFLSIVFVIIMYACNGGAGGGGNGGSVNIADSKGARVYHNYCQACHGADGKLGLSGASNLTVSVLSKPEMISVIANGRRLMAPFKDKLNASEIDSVAGYVQTLRK